MTENEPNEVKSAGTEVAVSAREKRESGREAGSR